MSSKKKIEGVATIKILIESFGVEQSKWNVDHIGFVNANSLSKSKRNGLAMDGACYVKIDTGEVRSKLVS